MSPKTRLPRISEEGEVHEPIRNFEKLLKSGSRKVVKTSTIGPSDFELLNTLDNGAITLGRKRDSCKLYALKSVSMTSPNALKMARSEEACWRLVNELKCPFLSRLQWSFEDQDLLYLVMACPALLSCRHLFMFWK
jgi:hypothetical protein